MSGRKQDSMLFYKFSSFIDAGAIYTVDFLDNSPSPKLFKEVKIQGLDTSLFEVEQVFYPSKDGTKIPMFIISKKVQSPLPFPPFLVQF